jgi:hypothetical protein
LINEVPDYNIDIHDLMEFARAILRKAQEKWLKVFGLD